MTKSLPIAIALLSLAAGPLAAANPDSMEDRPIAVLQGLDKITARVSTFEAPVGQAVRFGGLQVTASACKKAPPIETPEAAALLDIQEVKPDEGTVPLFKGWMFASSPALSALQHPVYDVWVVDCRKSSSAASSSAAGKDEGTRSAPASSAR
jgi:hypothetical protein